MVDIVLQVIQYYLQNNEIPTKTQLKINDETLFQRKGNVFITLYKNGNIHGSSGNIVEIESDIVNELIKNTIYALGDQRFERLTAQDIDKIKIRIDVMKNRVLIGEKNIQDINPIKSGVLVIKKDYNKLAVILPNISSTLVSGKELIGVLSKKLDESFVQDNYIVYEIETEVLSNY